MPIAKPKTNNYTLGAGKIFFDQWEGEDPKKRRGFMYLGSTSDFTLTSEAELLEHMNSEGGMRYVDAQVQTSSSMTGALTTDNISGENLALYFSGEYTKEAGVAATALKHNVKAYPGRVYFIGATDLSPQGEAKVTNVTVALKGTPATALVEGTDYELQGNKIMIDARGTTAVEDIGTEITITYDRAVSVRAVVVSSGKSIVGSLRFEADNATGPNLDYVLPKVRLTANGDYQIKGGDEWLAMSMSVAAMKEGDTPMLYINGRPEA